MSRSSTPYGSVPNPSDTQFGRGYGTQPGTGISDYAQGNPSAASPLAQSAQQPTGAFHEEFDASQRGSSVEPDGNYGVHRSASSASTAVQAQAPARSNTLKKKSSVKRVGSLKRSSSKRSLAAGSVKGLRRGMDNNPDFRSFAYTPIPTQGSPTEVLANRFQSWRQLLKSLIAYFREIQDSYDTRSKAIRKVQNTITNISHPSIFMSENGLGDATRILDDYHKRSIAEANKSRDIENDVIGALTGLRSDLGQKIKEIKSLSGDFKNSVDKEKEGTKREVDKLQEALQHADHEDGSATGKNDPFVVRLGVDRLVERQIDEENYLHRAYLNLESSGRELESIVIGEIQKAYNALAGILKREADDAYNAVEGLRSGPIAMPKDQEWSQFVIHDPHFVDPDIPLRRIEDIDYPGKDHPAAAEVRAGMLERKSKYLKSYTPGWYVLSPTHLHEFKSADKIYTQPPVMSLYLLDQRLGSKSDPGSSSNKFMLKGKQSGRGHTGHNWVFRAETHDTMEAWYNDIHTLTESTGEVRNAFVRKHARSVSGTSERGTVSSDGFEDDEADAEPYRADAASLAEANPLPQENRLQRPQPGGRFPSDMNVPRNGPVSPSSGSSDPDRDVIAAAAALPGPASKQYERNGQDPYRLDGVDAGTTYDYTPGPSTADYTYYDQTPTPAQQPPPVQPQQRSVDPAPAQTQTYSLPVQQQQPVNQQQAPPPTQQELSNYQQAPQVPQQPMSQQPQPSPQQPFLGNQRPNSSYGDWFAPAAAGAVGAGAGVAGAEYWRNKRDQAAARDVVPEEQPVSSVPEPREETNVGAFGANGAPAAVVPQTSSNVGADTAGTTSSGQGLGGLEGENAYETGHFPTIVRHATDMSISGLHIPGEYPKKL